MTYATGPAMVPSSEAYTEGAEWDNELGQRCILAYFASGFTQYKPYAISNTADTNNSPAAIAPATEADAVLAVCVPQGTTTSTAGWYPAVIKGVCDALCDGSTDIGLGDFLELKNAETALTYDHESAPTSSTCAIAREAYTDTTDAAKEVYLMGNFRVTT